MSNFWDLNGFWFAIGIAAGILIDALVRGAAHLWLSPSLEVSLEGLWPADTGATVIPPGLASVPGGIGRVGQSMPVTAFRFKVRNSGRRAARNVTGTLEFDGIERRVPWYEGNVSRLTVNAGDHSFLDAYGVVLAQGNPTRDIVMPTEHGWTNLYRRTLSVPLTVRLRVTAENCRRAGTAFVIDPNQGCKPTGG